MKKLKIFGLLALAVVLAFGLFGCGGSDDDDDSSDNAFNEKTYYSTYTRGGKTYDVETVVSKTKRNSIPEGTYNYISYIVDPYEVLSQGTVRIYNGYALFTDDKGNTFSGPENGGDITVNIPLADGTVIVVKPDGGSDKPSTGGPGTPTVPPTLATNFTPYAVNEGTNGATSVIQVVFDADPTKNSGFAVSKITLADTESTGIVIGAFQKDTSLIYKAQVSTAAASNGKVTITVDVEGISPKSVILEVVSEAGPTAPWIPVTTVTVTSLAVGDVGKDYTVEFTAVGADNATPTVVTPVQIDITASCDLTNLPVAKLAEGVLTFKVETAGDVKFKVGVKGGDPESAPVYVWSAEHTVTFSPHAADDDPIKTIKILGITAPVTLAEAIGKDNIAVQTTATTITTLANVTVTGITWDPALTSNKFAVNQVYTLEIALEAMMYDESEILANGTGVTVDGLAVGASDPITTIAIDSALTGSGTTKAAIKITLTFATTTALPVTVKDITLTPPVYDAEAVHTVTGTGFTGAVAWTPTVASGGKFIANQAYKADITLTADSPNYTLTGVNTSGWQINGSGTNVTAVDNGGGGSDYIVSFTFPQTGNGGGGGITCTCNGASPKCLGSCASGDCQCASGSCSGDLPCGDHSDCGGTYTETHDVGDGSAGCNQHYDCDATYASGFTAAGGASSHTTATSCTDHDFACETPAVAAADHVKTDPTASAGCDQHYKCSATYASGFTAAGGATSHTTATSCTDHDYACEAPTTAAANHVLTDPAGTAGCDQHYKCESTYGDATHNAKPTGCTHTSGWFCADSHAVTDHEICGDPEPGSTGKSCDLYICDDHGNTHQYN